MNNLDSDACSHNQNRRLAILFVLLSAVLLIAWRQDSNADSHGTADQPQWSALKASMNRMHMAMAALKPAGNSDVDFVRMMLPHHQAAIDMAKTELVYGKDPQMRRLAQEIITDQQSEVELMQLWLKQREPGAPKVNNPPISHGTKER